MGFSIEIRQLASLDIVEAFDWYESQKMGLGEEFLESLDEFFKSLLSNAHAYSYYKKPIRQGRLKRFPYMVVFETAEEHVIVYSVFMTGQDPSRKRTA
jgi:plasmid stabilization system protein ParE